MISFVNAHKTAPQRYYRDVFARRMCACVVLFGGRLCVEERVLVVTGMGICVLGISFSFFFIFFFIFEFVIVCL